MTGVADEISALEAQSAALEAQLAANEQRLQDASSSIDQVRHATQPPRRRPAR